MPIPPQQWNLRKNYMLVLSRKVGDAVVINENIVVEIVKIQGNRITLGIRTPANVKILRGDLDQPKAKT
jgi:carbon storage regulator